MTERTEKAAALAREIHKLGGTVISPLPLDTGAKLHFRVAENKRAMVIDTLRDWEWSPIMLSSGPQFNLDGSTPLSFVYEIDIPVERTAVANDLIRGELASPETRKTSMEVEALRRYLGK
jgi:hypothetical protein